MKTLQDLYRNSVELRDPRITDILFTAAYPIDTGRHSEQMRERSEKATRPFAEKWHVRLATQISNALDTNSTPEEIVSSIAWMTKEEYQELLEVIDTYVDDLSQAAFALKVMEFNSHLEHFKRAALSLLRSMFIAKQEQTKIVTPFSNPGGAPKLLGADGQILNK